MLAGFGLDKLDVYANAVPGAPHAALHEVVHAKLAARGLRTDDTFPVADDRLRMNNQQGAEAIKLPRNVVGDAFGKVVLTGIIALVDEGQHRYRRPVRRRDRP